MIYAFRLGPLTAGGSTYAYVSLGDEGAPLIHEAPTDAGALEVLKAKAFGELVCEPALAEAGKPLGLDSAALPPSVLQGRAVIAYELASGIPRAASKPDALAAFLRGAGAFWAAKSWEVVGPEERLSVSFLEGHAEVDGELSVVGGDGMRLPGVALCDARSALRELAALSGEARAEAALRLANLTIEMEREPAWAAEVIEEGFGLGRMPVATRQRDGAVGPMVTQDLLVAAALLEAIAAWTGLEDENAVGEGTAEAAGMKVVARVRASAALPPASAEGLTPVGAEPAAAAAPAEEPKPAASPLVNAEPAPDPAPAPPVEAAPPQAPAPAPALTPVAAPAPAATPRPVVPAPAAARSAPPEPPPPAVPAPEAPAAAQGWLTRALRSLRGEKPAEKPSRKAEGRRHGVAARPAAGQPSAARPPPPPAPPVDDADPFAPFARALRIAIPAAPPPASPADEAVLSELAGRVVETSRATAGELVSFPAVALQIVERVHDPKADARSVAGFIARDPALAADVVSVANSAAFRGVTEIESVHDAVARLGLGEVGRVASAVAARKVLAPPAGGGGPGDAGVFVRAVAVATAAAGAALRQRGARSDHVWLGGLLHDVGKVLARQLLARLASEPGSHLTPVHLGERVVERVHREVGEAALRQWALPAYLLEICAHHHDEDVPPEAVDLHLVRLTAALADLGDPTHAARAAREILQSAAALRMDAPAVRALAAELRSAEERARALAR